MNEIEKLIGGKNSKLKKLPTSPRKKIKVLKVCSCKGRDVNCTKCKGGVIGDT